MNLEEFLRAHHYTVAALSVLGTFSAVAVALFSSITALRASKTRISAGASINLVHHSSMQGKERPRFLVLHIRNTGLCLFTSLWVVSIGSFLSSAL